MPIEKLLTPVGRIVWGNPARAQIKRDQNTNQPVLRDGKQIEQWAFGLAIPKAEFNAQMWPLFQQEAASVYPQGTPQKFSWKLKDGDGVDSKGQPYRNREGYAGNWILTISTEAFAPQIFKFENNAYRQIGENEIKTGDYVRCNLTIKANVPANATHTPGLYINPNGIEFVGYGQEIVSGGADPDEMFKGQVVALPPGASAVPISAAPTGAPMPGQPQPGYQPAPQPAPAAYVPQPGGYAPIPTSAAPQPVYQPQPAPMPAPAHDFVANAGQPYPQPAPGYGPVPGAPAPQYGPAPAPGYPGVAPATTYPSNAPMPGYPQPR